MERTADDIRSLRGLRDEDPARFAEAFRQFERLYSEAFPPGTNLTERPDVFLERLATREPADGQPWFDIAVCLDPGSRSRVLGGICFELYRPSCCGFLTYAVVDENQRKKGIAGRLIRAAIQRLNEQAGGHGPRAIFAEAERPDRVREAVEVARERISILGRLGALHVPVPYVQPPLEVDGLPAEHLMLLVFPGEAGNREEPPPIERDVLAAFLTDLYRSLGASDHPGRVRSTANIGEKIVPLRI
jgi:GNAT superfamily N-acetyltransferase